MNRHVILIDQALNTVTICIENILNELPNKQHNNICKQYSYSSETRAIRDMHDAYDTCANNIKNVQHVSYKYELLPLRLFTKTCLNVLRFNEITRLLAKILA